MLGTQNLQWKMKTKKNKKQNRGISFPLFGKEKSGEEKKYNRTLSAKSGTFMDFSFPN